MATRQPDCKCQPNDMSRYSRARKAHAETIEGRRAVLEALRADIEITRILIADNVESGNQIREIHQLARNSDTNLQVISRRDLDRQSRTKKSQGVIAVLPDRRYAQVEDLILAADAAHQPPLIAVLDGIVDPHNLGAIARTAHAAGGHGLIIPERRAASVSPGAMRASAGALVHIPVARVPNIAKTLGHLQNLGLQTVALDAGADTSYRDADLTIPTALVIGSEERGISRNARQQCDIAVSIPMSGPVASLNASVSAAIVLYEAVRQRTDAAKSAPTETPP